jgi:hypothetical protein
MANMELLQEVKEMSTKIRNGNVDSGTHYLLGYLWASLTEKQQTEISIAFADEIITKLEAEKIIAKLKN